jgi:hypothetical protein
MSVIIEQISVDPVAQAPAVPAPRDPVGAGPETPLAMDQLRIEMLRDAQRHARLWAD